MACLGATWAGEVASAERVRGAAGLRDIVGLDGAGAEVGCDEGAVKANEVFNGVASGALGKRIVLWGVCSEDAG